MNMCVSVCVCVCVCVYCTSKQSEEWMGSFLLCSTCLHHQVQALCDRSAGQERKQRLSSSFFAEGPFLAMYSYKATIT